MSNIEVSFIEKIIELSQKAFDTSRFPAGAIVTLDDRIISEGIPGQYPHNYSHSEGNALRLAVQERNHQLDDYVLYCSMEPCLMCLGTAYWSGIKTIKYLIPKSEVDTKVAYEGSHSNDKILEAFDRKIELIQLDYDYSDALEIYKEWEEELYESLGD